MVTSLRLFHERSIEPTERRTRGIAIHRVSLESSHFNGILLTTVSSLLLCSGVATVLSFIVPPSPTILIRVTHQSRRPTQKATTARGKIEMALLRRRECLLEIFRSIFLLFSFSGRPTEAAMKYTAGHRFASRPSGIPPIAPRPSKQYFGAHACGRTQPAHRTNELEDGSIVLQQIQLLK